MDVRLNNSAPSVSEGLSSAELQAQSELDAPAHSGQPRPAHENTPLAAGMHRTLDKVSGGEALDSMIEVKSSNRVATDARFEAEAQDQLIQLAGTKFSDEAQQAFLGFLERSVRLPDDAPRLTWIANKIWELNRYRKHDISVMRGWYADRGMRIDPSDPLPASHPGYQLDRPAFRATLAALRQTAGGVIGRSAALELLGRLGTVVDESDLLWARGEIENRLAIGKRDEGRDSNAAMRFGDPKTERQFEAFFAGRLPGRRAFCEIGLEMRWLRQSGFAEEKAARIREMLAGCTRDDQAVFYAERAFHREVRKALRTAKTSDEAAKIEALRDELGTWFERRLDGRFDRYTAVKRLERQFRNGTIDEAQLLAMQAAAVTSSRHEEYAYGTMRAQVHLGVVQLQSQLIEAWSDIWETNGENNSGDERDSFGSIIRTAEEIELEYRREKSLIEQMYFKREKLVELSARAFLRASKLNALNAAAGARNPDRKASLEAAVASAQIQLQDIDPPVEPRG
jgi:hypothetical protein